MESTTSNASTYLVSTTFGVQYTCCLHFISIDLRNEKRTAGGQKEVLTSPQVHLSHEKSDHGCGKTPFMPICFLLKFAMLLKSQGYLAVSKYKYHMNNYVPLCSLVFQQLVILTLIQSSLCKISQYISTDVLPMYFPIKLPI